MRAYELVCVRAYEIVTPASKVQFSSMLTGEKVLSDMTMPEHCATYAVGQRTKERRKADALRLIRTGNWAPEYPDQFRG